MKAKTSSGKAKLLSILVILIIAGLSVYFTMSLMQNSRMETDLDEYMPKEHPAFVYSDQAKEMFNIKDGILIALENENGVFNPNTLTKIKTITEELQAMEEFEDIDVMSIYTADNITGSDGGMEVESFYDEVPMTKEELGLLRQKVRANDMVFKRLVSEDEKIALVVAGMNDSAFTEDFYNEILKFSKSFAGDGDKVHVAGRPIVEGTMGMLGPKDMKRMVPIVLVVIILVLYLLLRSVRATVATIITVFVSTIWAFGLMAITGVPIYSVSTMIPVMLIAIGVAYGIYFFNHLNHFYAENRTANREQAMTYVVKILTKPLAMAAFTTIIGFFSLVTSQVYPIKYFGIYTAFGIFASFLLTVVFLPSFVILFGYRGKNKKITDVEINQKYKNRVVDYLIKNQRLVYVIWIGVAIISIFGMSKVWINSSFLDKFEKDSEIVTTDRLLNKKFGGTSTLNVVLESKEQNAFKMPDALKLMDKMQEETEELAEVGNSFSLTDYLKRMNKVMNADDEKFYTVPASTDLIAQYMLLYEMSGDPENLIKVVNYDYNKTNITFQLKGDDSKTINKALEVIEGYKDDFDKLGIELRYAGSGYKALVFTDLILEGQVMSIIMSLALVFILLVVMFRSFKAGLIGSVPILLTALISFGVMGLLNIPLSTTTALLSSIAIGIGIDYAIHFIETYNHNLVQTRTRHDAIHLTMKHTGKAILFNAVVVISGFLVLLFSVFPPNRTLGALVSLNMFTSFIGTLSIMMIMVYNSKLFFNKHKINNL